MNPFILLFLFSVFVSSVSQIMLKKSAEEEHGSIRREYLNARVIVAYILFFCSTLLTVLAYRKVPLSLGPVLETTGYLWVALLGYLVLKEKISRRKCWGLIIIVIGIVISTL